MEKEGHHRRDDGGDVSSNKRKRRAEEDGTDTRMNDCHRRHYLKDSGDSGNSDDGKGLEDDTHDDGDGDNNDQMI